MKNSGGFESGIVKFYDSEKGIGLITPDDGNKKDIKITASLIDLSEGDKVKFMANKEGIATAIESGSDRLFDLLNETKLDLDEIGKDYLEIEKQYGETINQTLKYENDNILRSARNLTQSIGDEENYELIASLIEFIKATLPEAFKNIITITNFDRENIRKEIPDDIYDKFVDNPKTQEIMNYFIARMLKKFPKMDAVYNYPHKEGEEKGGLIRYAFKEVGSYIWMTLNCYMNNIDPAILEATPEEEAKRAIKSRDFFEKNKKKPVIISTNPEDLNNQLNKAIKHEKNKNDFLNNKN